MYRSLGIITYYIRIFLMSPYFSRSQRHVLKLQCSCRSQWVKMVNVPALVQKKLSWEFSDRKKGMLSPLSKCRLFNNFIFYTGNQSLSFVTIRLFKLWFRENIWLLLFCLIWLLKCNMIINLFKQMMFIWNAPYIAFSEKFLLSADCYKEFHSICTGP